MYMMYLKSISHEYGVQNALNLDPNRIFVL